MSGVAIPGLPPPRPIPLKDRSSIIFIQRGNVDVLDGAFVVVDKTGVRTHIPIGGLACLMLEPGARVSHAAVALAAGRRVPSGPGSLFNRRPELPACSHVDLSGTSQVPRRSILAYPVVTHSH
jgi:hypothetical protein